MNDSHDLRLIIESRIPVVIIETWEEKRALTLLSKLGIQLGTPVFAWSITDGLRRCDYDQANNQALTTEPEAALKHIRSAKLAGIYALCDFLLDFFILRTT